MQKTTINLITTGVFSFGLLLLAVASLEMRVSSLLLFFTLLYFVTNIVFFLLDRKDAKLQSEKLRACFQKLMEAEQKIARQQNSIRGFEQYHIDNKFSDLDEVRREIEREKTRLQEFALDSANQSLALTAIKEEYNKILDDKTKGITKLRKAKEIYTAISHCIDNFFSFDPQALNCKLSEVEYTEAELLIPAARGRIHAMDLKDLRKTFKENERNIEMLCDQYQDRYTTKSNQSIYALVTRGLRAELENILSSLKYEGETLALESIETAFNKAIKLAGEGNKNILPTLIKFLGQLKHYFIEAVKIEHIWYLRKEQAREEQKALRLRMRLEAEEQRRLEEEARKVEAEQLKYKQEIERLTATLTTIPEESRVGVETRLTELNTQMAMVEQKKAEIIKLQKGKAGTIYIISNLGSFGDTVFKIGMTRRFDPQERVDELGDASVPFEFDVHSFIFSEDAPTLETKIHQRLTTLRVNKINNRKEFFKISIDELETLIQEIEPTAEFTRTMAAEEYRASIEGVLIDDPDTSSDDEAEAVSAA